MFFQQWSFHNNIGADRGLNLFDEYVSGCVHLCPQEEECTCSKCTDHSKFTNRQRMPTKINKNGSAAKVRILVGLGIL